MKRWRRMPLRTRLTVAFAAGTTVVLGSVGFFAYVRMAASLLDTTDAGLRSRAEILAADVRARGPSLANVGSELIELDEAFVQVADASGRIVQSSSIVAGTPLLPPATIRSLPAPQFFDRSIPTIDNVTRVLAVPIETSDGHQVVLVGSSLQDRADELLQLAATLAIGGSVSLAVLSLVGWLLAGAALGPVERMRTEAAEISTAAATRRLTTPETDDEISRLGQTLNRMLDRIQASAEIERRFLDNASHELRTPLSILRSEVDLALSRSRSVGELVAALQSISEETDHLARLADDLLLLSRAHEGKLSIHQESVSLRAVVASVCARFEPAAERAGVGIEVDAADVLVSIDPVRLRQALDNLLANALRHLGPGDTVRVTGGCGDGWILLVIEDTGPGFQDETLPGAFEPFVRGADDGEADRNGAGLGLPIVRAIAEAHGGSAKAENGSEGGARITIRIPASGEPHPGVAASPLTEVDRA
jgi:two-component system, OmpR family, sensor kinase